MDKEANESRQRDSQSPCWGPERWARCCPGMGGPAPRPFGGDQGQDPMAKCFSCCWYFVVFLAIAGIILLAVGYYYRGPEVIKTPWMIGAGIAVAMALLAALAMRRMVRSSGFSGCCGRSSR